MSHYTETLAGLIEHIAEEFEDHEALLPPVGAHVGNFLNLHPTTDRVNDDVQFGLALAAIIFQEAVGWSKASIKRVESGGETDEGFIAGLGTATEEILKQADDGLSYAIRAVAGQVPGVNGAETSIQTLINAMFNNAAATRN